MDKTMNKWILILILGILLACGNVQNIRTTDPAVGKAESGKLTFMTFNIRAAGGMQNPVSSPDVVEETKESLTKTAAAINSADPDFIGLQEVRGLHQAKFIAEQLNLNYAYSVHARENWWGLAVLSKYKIIAVRTKIINLGGKNGDRIALMCTIDIGDRKLRVVNVDFVPENYKGQVQETMPLLGYP
jgi:endonuclease/exonuclease/phosphatase family metal-dependent hydrolase